VLLGLVILAGFFLPVLVGRGDQAKPVVPNILLLGEERVPGIVKFILLYPGLAGISVIVLALATRGIGRAITLVVLGVIPFVVMLASADVRGVSGAMLSVAPSSITAAMVLGLLAFLGLFVGSRARCFRPASLTAAIIGALGGGLYLVNLLLPLYPSAMGSIALLRPLKLMELGDQALVVGLITLGAMACMIAASILCIVNVVQGTRAQRLAHIAFRLFLTAIVLLVGAELVPTFWRIGQVEGVQVVASLLSSVKGLLWLGGLFLLIPVGITDLVVSLGPVPAPVARPAMAPSFAPVVPVAAAPVAPPAVSIAVTPSVLAVPAAPPAGPVPAAPPPAAPVPPAPAPREPGDAYARLEKLKQMLDNGLITEEEYNKKKSEILEQL